MRLIILFLLLSFSVNSAKSQGFYIDIPFDTLDLYGEREISQDTILNIYNSDGKIRHPQIPDDWKTSRYMEVLTLDTTQVFLGILRKEVTDFPHYYPDANYYQQGDSILILRLSTELGYKVGWLYYDIEWNLLTQEQIVFIKPKQ